MTQQLWVVDELRAHGLTVKEYPGWQSRTANGAFDPLGVLIHHTASAPSYDTDKLCAEIGHPGAPAPLCNLVSKRDGSFTMIAAGRANHAGKGAINGIIPYDGGNRCLFGIEMENDGIDEPFPTVQLTSVQLATAILLKHMGRPASYCWGHKEYALPPGRKTDPHDLNMDAFRFLVWDKMKELDGDMTPKQIETVRKIQQLCNDNGATVTVDGDPGDKTFEAVKGVVDYLIWRGTQTQQKLDKLLADIEAAKTAAQRQ